MPSLNPCPVLVIVSLAVLTAARETCLLIRLWPMPCSLIVFSSITRTRKLVPFARPLTTSPAPDW